MTMLFNNDGSIVITTPIIIGIVRILELKPHQKFAYLCSGAIIATASSAPIGVSNLSNLIALKIVGVDLVTHAKFMFVPSMIGISVISILLFIYFKNDLPKRLPTFSRSCMLRYRNSAGMRGHPLSDSNNGLNSMNWSMFRVYMTVIVLVRVCLFIFSSYGLPFEGAAVLGALIIIMVRWYSQGIGVADVLQKTPWHIFIFAFSMYLVVYGLHNVGFTALIIELIKEPVSANLLNGILIMGTLLTVMSSLFNNLPSVMLGTLTLTQMGLEPQYLQLVYLANIIGSDIGSLILPSGTLASLIWMFMLRINKIPVTWSQYLGVTILVIPIGLLVSLLSLYWWIILIS
jgi:arsenical pump membrane protein